MWPMGVVRSGNRHASTATPRCARNDARCAHCELLPLRSSPSSTISAPRLLLLLMGARAAAEGFALPPAIAIADASRWYATPATMPRLALPCVALRLLQRKLSSSPPKPGHRRSLGFGGSFLYPAPRKGIGIFDTRRVGEIRVSSLIVTQ